MCVCVALCRNGVSGTTLGLKLLIYNTRLISPNELDPILDTGVESIETAKSTMEVESKKKITKTSDRSTAFPHQYRTLCVTSVDNSTPIGDT